MTTVRDTATVTDDTVPCSHCGGPNLVERVTELSYYHCTKPECITAWVASRRAGMTILLRHKSGFQPQFIDQISSTNKNA